MNKDVTRFGHCNQYTSSMDTCQLYDQTSYLSFLVLKNILFERNRNEERSLHNETVGFESNCILMSHLEIKFSRFIYIYMHLCNYVSKCICVPDIYLSDSLSLRPSVPLSLSISVLTSI